MTSVVDGRVLCSPSSLRKERSPASASTSSTKTRPTAPVAMPMLRSGNARHQRLIRSGSVVAACRPASQAGALPRGWRGKQRAPFRPILMRRCADYSWKYPLPKQPPGVAHRVAVWSRLEVRHRVVEVFADRWRCAAHANNFVHLAPELLHVGIEANLLSRPRVVVFVPRRRCEP